MSIVDYVEKVYASLEHLYGNIIVSLLFLLFLIIASYTDIRTYKIPNILNGVFFFVRLALIPWMGFSWNDITGALIGFLGLFIPAMIKMQKMGGDIKCATVIGFYTGAYLIPVFLIIACIYFAIYTFFAFSVGKKIKLLPFAPFFLVSNITLMGIYCFGFPEFL